MSGCPYLEAKGWHMYVGYWKPDGTPGYARVTAHQPGVPSPSSTESPSDQAGSTGTGNQQNGSQ